MPAPQFKWNSRTEIVLFLIVVILTITLNDSNMLASSLNAERILTKKDFISGTMPEHSGEVLCTLRKFKRSTKDHWRT